MTDQEFAEYLALTHELTGVEFKGPGPRSNKQLFAKVVRAVLGMANRRDGGRVIIGVDDNKARLTPVGLNATDLVTWKYDDVADSIAAYVDPSVSFDCEIRQHKKKKYVVLHVQEFEDIPVLCKKDYQPTLRAGACYVRSRRKPETTEIPSQADMRDLLELATEKRLRRFVTQAQAIGLGFAGITQPTDQALFDKQREDLQSSALLPKIQSRGYLQVVIRPSQFSPKRITNIASLYPLVQNASVELRGWSFPHLDSLKRPHIDIDWVGQEYDWNHYLEIWRLYQSGQFFHSSGIFSDWRDQSNLWPPPPGWKSGTVLGVGDELFRFTEIFEFAARLAVTEAGDDTMHIGITVGGLQNRTLQIDIPGRNPMFQEYTASIDKFPYEENFSRVDLIATPRELALRPALELFHRFGWSPSLELLRELQAGLRKV